MTDAVAARGVELAVDVVGGRGPALVWGHGLTSCRESEDERRYFTWHADPDEPWQWVRYDARGHGQSGGTPDPATYRWDALAGDMLAVADHAGADRFVAGGASMGCASALYAALLAPERVDALVLVIPPTAWETRVAQRAVYLNGATFVEEFGTTAFLEARANQPRPEIFAGEPEMPIRAWVDAALLPSVLRGAAISDLPERDRLAGIAQPVLILAWDTDPVHPVSTAEQLAECLPAADLHVAATVADLRKWPYLVSSFVTSSPARP